MASQVELTNLNDAPPAGVYGSEPVDDGGAAADVVPLSQDQSNQTFSLPPVDGGKDAWMFLAGCFMIEALVWGFPFSFGVFQEYYSTHEPFTSNPAGIANIGTTATGIAYLSGPFLFPAYIRWPSMRRPSLMIGLPVLALSLVLASFSNEVWQLVLTQGVLYAIGGCFLYYPTIVLLDEWFVRRKGLAYGIMWAGTGFSGVLIPFVMTVGLEKYGFRTMLRAWAVAVVVLMAPLMVFVKPRLPVSMASRQRRIDFRFLVSPVFWVLEIANIIEGLGYFIPSIYLSSFANSIGLQPFVGTLLVSFINLASVFGGIFAGWLIDILPLNTVQMVVSVSATVAVLLAWGLSESVPLLCIFGLLYGLTAGGFSSTWPGVVKEIQRQNTGAELGVIFGFLAAGRGIGAVASGPLSEALLKEWSSGSQARFAYGTQYGGLILFTAGTAAAGCLGGVARKIGWI